MKALLLTLLLSPGLGYADDTDKITEQVKKLQQETEMARDNFLHVDVEPTRKLLKAFRTASDVKTKIQTGSELTLIGVKLDASSKKQWPFTPDERKGFEEAKSFMEELNRQSVAFESGLAQSELKQITQDQPGSLTHAMKRLFLTSYPTCTQDQFRMLKKKWPASDLAARGKAVMMLAGAYEDQATQKYLPKVLKVLKETPRYAKYRNLLVPYYGLMEQNADGAPLDRIAEYEKELVDSGVPRSNLRKYVTETAALSPDCLGRLNIPFVKQWKKAVNEERGTYLLGRLRLYIAKSGDRPATLDKVTIQEGHSVYGDRKDPYGTYYEVSYVKGAPVLTSKGPDAEVGGGDDLHFGP